MDPLKRKSSNDFSQNPGISVSSSNPTDEDLDGVPEGLLDSVLSFLAAPLYFPYTPQSDESNPQGQNPLTSSNDPQFEFASGSSSGSKQLNDWDDGDAWLSIEDVKLLTEPSSAPVPSRRPPSVPSLDDGGQKEIENKPFASSSSSFSSTVKPTTQAGPATDPERDVIFSTLAPSTSSPQVGGCGVQSVSAGSSTTTFTVPRADDWTWVLDAALKSKCPNSEPVRKQALQRGPENDPDNVAAGAQSLPQHQSQSQQLPNLDIAARAARETKIKQWAAGKVGNLRALLSSLHEILWPGCGWSPVSLAELITPASVKKVYRAALLHVHPDKIQRVGATAEQKYIAESVFNLLNEAFRKFNTQELH